MPPTMKQRIDGKSIKYGEEFFNKLVTKTFPAAVIPRGDLDNFIVYFRSDDNLPLRRFLRDRRPSFRASKDKDEVGFER